jgi:hypothetical protein
LNPEQLDAKKPPVVKSIDLLVIGDERVDVQ